MTEKRGEPFEIECVGDDEVYSHRFTAGRYLCIPLLEGERLKRYRHEAVERDGVRTESTVKVFLTREPAHQERGEDRRSDIPALMILTTWVENVPGLCRRKQGERRQG